MDKNLNHEDLLILRQQTILMRNEICCKLGQLIDASTPPPPPPSPFSRLIKLTGTASFATTSDPSIKSISLSVISLTTGTVNITDSSSSTTDISYAGYSASWDSPGNITISTIGDAIVLITYAH